MFSTSKILCFGDVQTHTDDAVMTLQGEISLNYCWCSLFREDYENEFTDGGWSQLVEAVEQRNSTEGMSQLKLVGGPTVYSEEESNESDEGSGESEEESNEPDSKQ